MSQAAKKSDKRKQPPSKTKDKTKPFEPPDDEAMGTDIKKPRNTVLFTGAKELKTIGIDIGEVDKVIMESLSPYNGPKRNDTDYESKDDAGFKDVQDVAALSIYVDSFRKFYLVKRSDGQQVLVTKWNDEPDSVMYYSK